MTALAAGLTLYMYCRVRAASPRKWIKPDWFASRDECELNWETADTQYTFFLAHHSLAPQESPKSIGRTRRLLFRSSFPSAQGIAF